MADATDGMADAFRSIGDAARMVKDSSPELGENLTGLAKSFREGTTAFEYLRTEIVATIQKLQEAKDKDGEATIATAKLTTALTQMDNSVKKANFEKFSKSVGDVTDTIVSAIDGIGAATRATTGSELTTAAANATSGLAKLAMGLGGAAALIAPEFGIPLIIAGGALKLFGSAATNAITVVDASAKAQEKSVNAMLQSGVAIAGHTAEISTAAHQATQFGMALGLTKEQSGDVTLKLVEMGARVGQTASRLTDLSTSSQAQGKELESVVAISRGLGIGLDSATAIVGTFSARAGLSGDEITEASGKTKMAVASSGVSAGNFTKNFTQLADSSRQYGTNIDALLARTAAYSSELARGTMSISSLIAMTDVQSQSQENQAALADHIMQTDRELANKMGLVQGDVIGNTQRLGKHSEMASDALVKWAREIGKQAGGGVDAETGVMRTFLKGWGTDLQDASLAEKIYLGTVGDVAGEMKKLKESTPGEAFKSLKLDADSVFKNLRPASEQLNLAAANINHATAEAIRRSGELGPALSGVRSDMTPSGPAPELKKERSLYEKAMMPDVPAMATGGLIPQTGLYLMHAGENVSRSGSSSGANISIGGVQVSISASEDMSGQLGAAFDKLKRDILRQIEDQWNQAHLAH